MDSISSHSCFDGHECIANGPLHEMAVILKHHYEAGSAGKLLIFDNRTGKSMDVNIHGTREEVAQRYRTQAAPAETEEAAPEGPRGRGRPKLGVIPREVTLLPRHWEWLEMQPGGASVALRRLVEVARLANVDKDRLRLAQERAYHFMSAMAGDLPGFEEAARALFANDEARLRILVAEWPTDVSHHLARLLEA